MRNFLARLVRPRRTIERLRTIYQEVDRVMNERDRYRRALETINSQSDEGLRVDPTWAKGVAFNALRKGP